MLRCFISPMYDMYLMSVYLHHLSRRGHILLLFLKCFPMFYICIDKHAAKCHDSRQQDYPHGLKDHFPQFLSLFILFFLCHTHAHRLQRLIMRKFRDHLLPPGCRTLLLCISLVNFLIAFSICFLVNTHTRAFTSIYF